MNHFTTMLVTFFKICKLISFFSIKRNGNLLSKIVIIVHLISLPLSNLYACLLGEKYDVSFGFKTGIHINKLLISENLIGFDLDDFPKTEYPCGFLVSVILNIEYTKNISFISELSFVNQNSKQTVYTGYEGIVVQQLFANYIQSSISISYDTNHKLLPYFLLGFDVGFLTGARYKSYDKIYMQYDDIDIGNHMSSLEFMIHCSLGKEFKFLNMNNFLEIRNLISLNKNDYENIGTWKNFGIQIIYGFRFSD